MRLTLRKGFFRVIVRDSIECECYKGRITKKGQSHLIRGIIAGIIEGILEEVVEIKETLCIAKGDPYCEFTVVNKLRSRSNTF